MPQPPLTEAALLAEILRDVGARPDVRLWRSNTGAARDTRTGRMVRFGVSGQGDLTGIVHAPVVCPDCGHVEHVGRYLNVEVKSPRGRPSLAQQRFDAMIERYGGLSITARSVADVLTVLERERHA